VRSIASPGRQTRFHQIMQIRNTHTHTHHIMIMDEPNRTGGGKNVPPRWDCPSNRESLAP
jgi:hypothetical protein